MASSTPIRLPWRAINRAVTTNPLVPATSNLFRTQQCTKPQQTAVSYRNASNLAAPQAGVQDATPRSHPSISTSTSSTTSTDSTSPYDESSVAIDLSTPAMEARAYARSKTDPETLRRIRESIHQNALKEALEDKAPVDTLSEGPRLPRSVQAVYLRPLKRTAEFGVPSCDLQLRSYSVRNLEFFADFCLRAAYYLGLPASGPVPLPRIVERWTVPRSSFIFKKSQENFERRTVRRLIQIKDGNPETVEVWLAFLRKHAYYGVGMKANIFEFEKLGVGKTMDIEMEQMKDTLNQTWDQVGLLKPKSADQIMELVNKENFRVATTGNAPYSKVHPDLTKSVK